MGSHMASNLMKAGQSLTVFDKMPKSIDNIKASADRIGANIRIAKSPVELAEECQSIITMLPSSSHVHDVYTNNKTGILAASSTHRKLLIDSSTIDPGMAQLVAREAAACNHLVVDAPVSGGITGAEAGTLTFMVGGSATAFESVKPILSLMGRNIVHCGECGSGQIFKVCNNLVAGITMAGVSEAMAIGVRLGAEPETLAGIFNTSSGRCWASDAMNPVPGVMPHVPAGNNWEGGFGSTLLMKDLGLAIDAAQQANMKSEMGEFTLSLYKRLEALGLQHKDFGVIYKMYVENLSNRNNW